MKAPIFISLLLTLSSVRADMLFGPASLVLNSNEFILFSDFEFGAGYGPNHDAMLLDGQLVHMPNQFSTVQPHPSDAPYAIAGPITINLTNTAFFNYQRLSGPLLRTVVIPTNDVVLIDVPTNRDVVFFPANSGSDSIQPLQASIEPPGSTNTYRSIGKIGGLWPQRYSGPLRIRLSGAVSWDSSFFFVTYYFTDASVQPLPHLVSGLPGAALEISVEKSGNLTNWTPTALINAVADTNSFYRLRISR